jgi:hypothetical protein
MGASGCLTRKLDGDLIERLLASGRIERKDAVKSKDRFPRPAATYRAARRNAVRKLGLNLMQRHAPEVIEEIAPAAYLNRSDRWPRAKTYAYAREIGPSTEPVR